MRSRCQSWLVALSQLSFGCNRCSFFSRRRRHTRCYRDWSSDVCSSDLRIGKDATPATLVVALAPLNVAPLGLDKRASVMLTPGSAAQWLFLAATATAGDTTWPTRAVLGCCTKLSRDEFAACTTIVKDALATCGGAFESRTATVNV